MRTHMNFETSKTSAGNSASRRNRSEKPFHAHADNIVLRGAGSITGGSIVRLKRAGVIYVVVGVGVVRRLDGCAGVGVGGGVVRRLWTVWLSASASLDGWTVAPASASLDGWTVAPASASLDGVVRRLDGLAVGVVRRRR